jgi:hypothetical protein
MRWLQDKALINRARPRTVFSEFGRHYVADGILVDGQSLLRHYLG